MKKENVPILLIIDTFVRNSDFITPHILNNTSQQQQNRNLYNKLYNY